jgi:Family of unknown function (DUF6262)
MTVDRTAALIAAAHRRHDDTRRKATEALRYLDTNGTPITFAVVAQTAGISRAWLYRDPTIRTEIDRLRRRPTQTGRARPAAERATNDSIRQRLDALQPILAEFRAENQRLRNALARKLGDQRTRPNPDQD